MSVCLSVRLFSLLVKSTKQEEIKWKTKGVFGDGNAMNGFWFVKEKTKDNLIYTFIFKIFKIYFLKWIYLSKKKKKGR